MDSRRLNKQVDFLVEIDKLKNIYRRSFLMDGEKNENSAEHSWHVAMMSILLIDYSEENTDQLHVLKMLLIHDIVEIDAGDTFCYDETAALDKESREKSAADRLFNILPPDQAAELRELWNEFEAGITPEAKFASALDRLMPILHNYFTEGKGWKLHGVRKHQVISRNRDIRKGSEVLWKYARSIIDESVKLGYLAE